MMRCFQGWLALPCLLGAMGAAAADNPAATARDALQQWVQTRQLISRTQAEWAADRELLEQTRALFERELQAVTEQLGKVSTNSTVADAERTAAEVELKTLEAGLARSRELVAGLEREVRSLVPLFPAPLLETVQPLLNRLPENPAETKAGVTERMQTVVALLNEADKFQNAVTVANEKRANAQGEQVSVDTLYLGFGAAYFVDGTGSVAGIGVPGAQGWEWTLKPGIGGAVQNAIAMYRSQKPAAFVGLPAKVQ